MTISKTILAVLDEEPAFPRDSRGEVQIGANHAAPLLVAALRTLKEPLENFATDIDSIRSDGRYSEAFRQKKLGERIAGFAKEMAPILERIGILQGKLTRETDDLMSRVKGLYEPQDVSEELRAAEIRSLLRALPFEDRGRAIQGALATKDPATLAAIRSLPSWDHTIITSDEMKALVHAAIREGMAAALEPDEKLAVDNAQSLLDLSARKLGVLDEGARRIVASESATGTATMSLAEKSDYIAKYGLDAFLSEVSVQQAG